MPSTNAVYTFKNARGEGNHFHVYDNCDAYPSGAAEKLSEALTMGDVARSTCPEIKDGSRLSAMSTEHALGNFPDSLKQLVPTPRWEDGPATNFRYEIDEREGTISITVFTPDFSELPEDFRLSPGHNFPNWREIYKGSLESFGEWAKGKNYIGDYEEE